MEERKVWRRYLALLPGNPQKKTGNKGRKKKKEQNAMQSTLVNRTRFVPVINVRLARLSG